MKKISLPISTARSLHLYLQSKRAADAWKVGKKKKVIIPSVIVFTQLLFTLGWVFWHKIKQTKGYIKHVFVAKQRVVGIFGWGTHPSNLEDFGRICCQLWLFCSKR